MLSIKDYLLDRENLIELVIYICAVIYVAPGGSTKTNEQIAAGAISVFLAWINFSLFLKTTSGYMTLHHNGSESLQYCFDGMLENYILYVGWNTWPSSILFSSRWYCRSMIPQGYDRTKQVIHRLFINNLLFFLTKIPHEITFVKSCEFMWYYVNLKREISNVKRFRIKLGMESHISNASLIITPGKLFDNSMQNHYLMQVHWNVVERYNEN